MKNLLKCAIYDVKQGTCKRYRIYILTILLYFLWAMNMYSELHKGYQDITLGDIAVKLFFGVKIYTKGMEIQIPYIFLVCTAFFGLSIGNYVTEDYRSMGVLHIIRYRDKKVWWYGKCIWNIWHTLLMYLAVFSGIFLFGCLIRSISWNISPQLSQYLEYPMLNKDTGLLWAYLLGLGMIYIMTCNQIQITLQMIFGTTVAYAVYLANFVFSVCFYNKFLPGNYGMLCRTKIFQEDGVEIGFGIPFLLVLWIIAVIVGKYYVDRRDLLVMDHNN